MSRREPENTDPTINIDNIHNVNIACKQLLPTPSAVEARLPLRRKAAATVLRGRRTVESILDRHDPRLLVIVGPCSIHDLDAGREYALRLRTLADELGDTIFVVMRVYFEKPRTAVGWKGFVNDPYLDGSFQVAEGLLLARGFLLELAEAEQCFGDADLAEVRKFLEKPAEWSAAHGGAGAAKAG